MAQLPSTPQPPELVAEPVPSDAHRFLPTPFLTKTYQLVDDPTIDDVISWNEDGSTFVVWRPAEFARDLLPKYFKHNNFSSFVRQLNTYGFRKIVPDRWEFANDSFRRGEKQLLCDIHRRKIQPLAPVPAIPTAVPVAVPASRAVSPTNSADDLVRSPNSSLGAAPSSSGRGSGGPSTELLEENSRLRKENERLNHELSQMKGLCNNIVLLMSKYAGQQPHQHKDDSGCPQAAEKPPPQPPPPPMSPLELMPLTRCLSERRDEHVKTGEERRSPSPRLFGVPIGLKRARAVEDEDASAAVAADDHPQPQRATEVKPEPVDPTTVDSSSGRDPQQQQQQQQQHHHRWRPHSTCRSNQKVCN